MDALDWTKNLAVYESCRIGAVLLHEWCHLGAASIVTDSKNSHLTVNNLLWSALRRKVNIPALQKDGLKLNILPLKVSSTWKHEVVQHAGWMGSVVIAALGSWWCLSCSDWDSDTAWFASLGLSMTALDAVASDLLGMEGEGGEGKRKSGVFWCGNFGLVLFSASGRVRALEVLQTMIRVTMIRGAQAGGVITHLNNDTLKTLTGSRSRVVSGKRTDLSDLIMERLRLDMKARTVSEEPFIPPIFQGHTRFATSSMCTIDGTHPHQWSPESRHRVWGFDEENFTFKSRVQNCGVYITHNGDFDFWEMNKELMSRESLVPWLEGVLHFPEPSAVDSASVAGMMDLLLCQGVWHHAVRNGFVFGVTDASGKPNLAGPFLSSAGTNDLAQIFEEEWTTLVNDLPPDFFKKKEEKKSKFSFKSLAKSVKQKEQPQIEIIRERMKGAMYKRVSNLCKAIRYQDGVHYADGADGNLWNSIDPASTDDARMIPFIDCTVDAFLDNDLLHCVKFFLKNALGSFGLCVSWTISADQQLVIASRGQTMSAAFYPETGHILYGSEQASVKAALEIINERRKLAEHRVTIGENGDKPEDEKTVAKPRPAFRIDLDDLGGEFMLFHWAKKGKTPYINRMSPDQVSIHTTQLGLFEQYEVAVTVGKENGQYESFMDRRVMLEDNPNVLPLPCLTLPDPVQADIYDIPRVVNDIIKGTAKGVSINGKVQECFFEALLLRMQERLKEEAKPGHGLELIDLFIVGCEVSLWAGEQFAADLRLLVPRLRVKALSANKVLAHFGQKLAAPQTGFQFSETSFNLQNCVVLIISHSGGTFSSLAVSHLLKGFTPRIFAVCGEGDTQIGRSLRQSGRSHCVFSTGVGLRPAEPCSISLVATHQLLTELLLHLMKNFLQSTDAEFKERNGIVHSINDIKDFDVINRTNVAALEDIIGISRHREVLTTETNDELKEIGLKWSEHILEAPISWLLSAFYIVCTVAIGLPFFIGVSQFFPLESGSVERIVLNRVMLVIDAAVYIFLPLWTTMLLRLIQGRTLLHRLGTRSLVIGDIPWVSQSLDAFISKMFACSYSIASLNVYSGNPADHLVHRFTHRVVRGALLAVGRPDGRLSGLTSAENAVCLSVNQASSIMSLGARCESLTLGHNPFKLPLTWAGVFLPGNRPKFLCEQALTNQQGETVKASNDEPSDEGRVGKSASDSPAIGRLLSTGSSSKLSRNDSGSKSGKRRSLTTMTSMLSRNKSGKVSRSKSGGKAEPQGTSSSELLAQYTTLQRKAQTPKSRLQRQSTVADGSSETGTPKAASEINTPKVDSENNSAKAPFNEGLAMAKFDTAVATEVAIQSAEEAEEKVKQKRSSLDVAAKDTTDVAAEVMSGMKRSWSDRTKKQSLQEMEAESASEHDAKKSRSEDEGGAVAKGVEAGAVVVEVEGEVKKEVKDEIGSEKDEEEEINQFSQLEDDMSMSEMLDRQHVLQNLYEARLASMQRFVAFVVMFHTLATAVQRFWPRVSFGLLRYQTHRTHSIMRIATTASPVSGMDVRDRMKEFARLHEIEGMNEKEKIAANQPKILELLEEMRRKKQRAALMEQAAKNQVAQLPARGTTQPHRGGSFWSRWVRGKQAYPPDSNSMRGAMEKLEKLKYPKES